MKSFLVIGLGAFGEAVAKTLYSLDLPVMGVDINRGRVEKAREFASEVVEADVTDREAVEQIVNGIGADGIEAAVVAIGTKLDVSVLVCLYLLELGVERVVAKVLTHEHARILEKLGVQETIFPEANSGGRLAHALARHNLVDLLPLGEGIGIMEVAAPKRFFGKTLAALRLPSKHGLLVVGIRSKEKLTLLPGADTEVAEGDALIVLGPEEGIKGLAE